MKLLFITQRVNKNDPVLGFVHLWLSVFSQYFSSIEVICLEAGDFSLPDNVSVHSLGKEHGRSRSKYLYNLFRIVWQQHRKYDVVFVHMNVEYAFLLGWWWRLWHRRVVLWYNHRSGSLLAKVAAIFATVICYTSPFSFFAKNHKAVQMPAGIDTTIFALSRQSRIDMSLLCLGRISAIKNIDTLIDALLILGDAASKWYVKIIGDPTEVDAAYAHSIYKKSQTLVAQGILEFSPAVTHYDAVKQFQSMQWYANMTNSGSLDKTILEAMSCGSLPIVSNQSFRNIVPEKYLFIERNAQSLAQALSAAAGSEVLEQDQLRERYRGHVVEHHSLEALAKRIYALYVSS